jgi:hypothetical protein
MPGHDDGGRGAKRVCGGVIIENDVMVEALMSKTPGDVIVATLRPGHRNQEPNQATRAASSASLMI